MSLPPPHAYETASTLGAAAVQSGLARRYLSEEVASVGPTRPGRPQERGGKSLLDRLRALRPYQWIKNALVFAPLVALHETDEGYPRLGAFEAVREKAAAGAPPRFVSGLSRRLAP